MAMKISCVLVLLSALGQTIAQSWSSCSQTCGGGNHFKIERCASADVNKCPKTYKECNTHACPFRRSCSRNQEFYYGSKSSCCSKSKETCGVSQIVNHDNIFEAKETVIGQWPWAAVIVYKISNTRFCGAILIHKDWVLAAGHCAESTPESHYVLLGSTSIEKPQSTRQIIGIKKFIPHPKYEYPVNDIALFELERSAVLNDYVKPICLPQGEIVKPDTTCVAAGWGNANLNAAIVGGVLRYVSLRNIPEDACRNGVKNITGFTDKFDPIKNLCFAVLSGKDYECSGDSGGPIMCQRRSSCGWYLAGVASFGPTKCGLAGHPEVYTKIKNYEKWIKSHVKGLLSSKVSGELKTFTSRCSKTCGGGHHYIETCTGNDRSQCEKIYVECNTHACRSLSSCKRSQNFRYGSKSSCCTKNHGTCGVSLVHRIPEKIFEAKKTAVGEWPWAAVIVSRMSNTRFCSAVLIHKDWVLTAGHCVENFVPDDSYIILGGTWIEESQATKQKRDIKSFFIHEEYEYPSNDIGLIEMKKSAFIGDSVQPVCLPNGEEVKSDATCVTAGWGNANLNGPAVGGVLRHVSQRRVPEAACLVGLKDSPFIKQYNSKKNLCFAVLSGKDYQCSGDTGGPIMCQRSSSCEWFVAGLASYGPTQCGTAGQPEVYMQIKGYEAWIRQKISVLPSPTKAPGGSTTFTSPCTKTCGGGHQYTEKCADGESRKCEKTYMECNTRVCTSLGSCPKNYEFNYGGKSSCCEMSKGFCGVPSVKRNGGKIFNAKKTAIGEWPWAAVMASRMRNTRVCSGVLIHKDWVLIAGHCVRSDDEASYYVLLGGTAIEQSQRTKQMIDIKSFIIHENYQYPVNDIGLIELKKSAILSYSVKPICLPNNEEVKADLTCVSVGWGNANLDGPVYGGILRHVSQRHLPGDACLNGLKHNRLIGTYNSKENLCFAVLTGKSYHCSGDSGGPIMCQRSSSCEWFVAGMASYGPNPCGNAGQPEVYMRVKGYEAWIRQKIRVLPSPTKAPDDSTTTTSTCTKTCGGGHQYIEKCADSSKCEKTYKECNTQACPSLASCPRNYEFSYGSKSSCCKKSDGPCGVSSVTRTRQQIFNAKKTAIGEWPWAAVMVLRRWNTRSCSGVLIHEDWVLVAGHCVQLENEAEYYILLGGTSIEQSQTTKQIIDIKSFILHENYEYPVNDIGLIELKKSATLNDYVNPICLPNGEEVKTDSICVSAGWGNANLNVQALGGILRHVSLRHLTEDACLNELKGSSLIGKYNSTENLCFAVLSGKNYQCSGDSGGPIMCQKSSSCEWFVAGMGSYGPIKCGTAGKPGVYMQVKAFEAWIREKIIKLQSPTQAPGDFDTFTQCSQSCGGGYRYKVERCIQNDINICRKIYEECNAHACSSRSSCPQNHDFRFKSNSLCCAKTTETCGTTDQILGSKRRVVGGKMSESGQWPWTAVIVDRANKTTHGGGSLIHEDWILTAAHCIDIYDKKDYYILLGSTSIKYPKATKQIIEIEEFIPHDQYSDPWNDVGLIKLKTSATFTRHVRPICLPHGEQISIDTTCVAAGWGVARREDIDFTITSDVLQHVSLRCLPNDACKNGLRGVSWRINYYDDEKNMCFGILSGNKDTCSGDSGGPIMCQRCSSCGWYVAGITSYGPKICGTAGQPGVYMKVEKYESWIRQKVYGSSSYKDFSC